MLFVLSITQSRTVCAIDVYVVAGQSNGWRISHLAQGKGGPTGRSVHYFGMKCVSEPTKSDVVTLTSLNEQTMGYGLGAALSKLSDEDIVFLQYCRCGAGVWNATERGWYPGDDPANGKLFNDGLVGSFQKYLAHAEQVVTEDLKLTWNVRGLFWHQGESDSNRAYDDYERNLGHLFIRFRQEFGTDLPIVAGHIRELTDGDLAINATLDRMAAADPLLAVVPTRDLPFAPDRDGVPDVHISREGCHELGRRMVAAFAEMTADRR